MCGLAKMSEHYMFLIKGDNGYRAFCFKQKQEAEKARQRIKKIEKIEEITIECTGIYYGNGPALKKTVHHLNAKDKLLGIHYHCWNPLKKFAAHYRIWEYPKIEKLIQFKKNIQLKLESRIT